jgi:hypothetical protein
MSSERVSGKLLLTKWTVGDFGIFFPCDDRLLKGLLL